jgi:hypothetical protein
MGASQLHSDRFARRQALKGVIRYLFLLVCIVCAAVDMSTMQADRVACLLLEV